MRGYQLSKHLLIFPLCNQGGSKDISLPPASALHHFYQLSCYLYTVRNSNVGIQPARPVKSSGLGSVRDDK